MANDLRCDAAKAMFDSWLGGEHDADPDQSEEHVWSMVLAAVDAVDLLEVVDG